MEILLASLPIIFSMLTGILIAGSLLNIAQTGYVMYLSNKLHCNKHRKSDLMQIAGGVLVTSNLLFLMFYATEFVAFHIQSLIFMEILYACFLCQIISQSTVIIEKINKAIVEHPNKHSVLS